MAFGRTLLSNSTVNPTRVSADGVPFYKPGGITVDWANSVSALGSDTTYPDGSVVKSGAKVLRYGQVLCRITGSANTVTIGGTPTGGTFTLTVGTDYPVPGGATQTTTALAYNASAATVQAALVALTNVGAGNAVVSGSAGGPYTIVFGTILGTVVVTGNIASLTGGTPTFAAGSSIAAGNTQGYFGPYDSSASDGRQNLNKGDCFILDETVLQYGLGGSTITAANDQIGGVFDGGLAWVDRIIQSGAGTHSLAAGPTLAELTTAFPRLSFAKH